MCTALPRLPGAPLLTLLLLPALSLLGSDTLAQAGRAEHPAAAATAAAAPAGDATGQLLQLLQRMDRALHQLDYIGTLVYAERGRIETLRVFHAGGGSSGGERERLVSLTGEAREIVREHGRVTCIGSAGASRSYSPVDAPALAVPGLSVDARGALPALPPALFAGALPHYEVVAGGIDRVAGQAARQVDIRARDAFRYSYRLWIDEASALLLKSLRYGADGSTIDQLMFTEVRIGTAPSEADLQPSANAQPVEAAAAPAGVPLASARWAVRDLPPGFHLTAVHRDGDSADEHHVYSDGLASVSVYIEAGAAAPNAPLSTSRGAISAFSRQLDGSGIYVIGDVPERTAQRIAHGVVGNAAVAGGSDGAAGGR